jgi:hypothetical protein
MIKASELTLAAEKEFAFLEGLGFPLANGLKFSQSHSKADSN